MGGLAILAVAAGVTGAEPCEEATLTALDVAVGDHLGFSVALGGDTAILGAPYDQDGGRSAGAAYVNVRIGSKWVQQAKLTAPDAAEGDILGLSVAIQRKQQWRMLDTRG